MLKNQNNLLFRNAGSCSIFISTGSSVYASESYNQKVNEIEKVVDNQLKKMENMTPAEKLDEVNRL